MIRNSWSPLRLIIRQIFLTWCRSCERRRPAHIHCATRRCSPAGSGLCKSVLKHLVELKQTTRNEDTDTKASGGKPNLPNLRVNFARRVDRSLKAFQTNLK